ncbi:clathrin coat assembly protein [Perkinsela sp. CCAP 1560/4]|nr:clathrin coat assembly protein [Perkinsela sp. CCAP 1560/4]|eukprot:KNH04379.1 clathrin coat assembly protein [Perkinsela sp. CCAP 1560/4]
MSTNDVKNAQDLKKIGTYLSNKWKVLLTRHNEDLLSRAILKVTSPKSKCPNEKHMERLLLYTYELGSVLMEYSRALRSGGYSKDKRSLHEINSKIIDELETRLHTHQWTVVLKTLIVLHRLMKDGSSGFQQVLCSRNGIFCVSKMKDLSDVYYGRSIHRFVRRYAMSLEERLTTTREISTQLGTFCNLDDFSKWKTYILTSKEDIVWILPSLLSYLESILQILIYPNTIDNPVVALAWMFLAQDIKQVVHLLSEVILIYIESRPIKQESREILLTAVERYNMGIENAQTLLTRLHQVSPAFGFPTRLQTVPMDTLQNILNL